MAQLAGQRHPEPDNTARLALAQDAIAMARRLEDPEALRMTLSGVSIAMTIFGPPMDALALSHELLQLALASGEKRIALRTHMFLVGTNYELGDLDSA